MFIACFISGCIVLVSSFQSSLATGPRSQAKYSKPVIVHSRYAWKDALRVVQDSGIEKAVFHWFTGFSSVLKEIIDCGYFISATPATEYHEEHRRAVGESPLDKLLLETDCPVTYGREARYESRPADVLRTLRAVSQLKGIDEATIAERTTSNGIAFFSLDVITSDARQSQILFKL